MEWVWRIRFLVGIIFAKFALPFTQVCNRNIRAADRTSTMHRKRLFISTGRLAFMYSYRMRYWTTLRMTVSSLLSVKADEFLWKVFIKMRLIEERKKNQSAGNSHRENIFFEFFLIREIDVLRLFNNLIFTYRLYRPRNNIFTLTCKLPTENLSTPKSTKIQCSQYDRPLD